MSARAIVRAGILLCEFAALSAFAEAPLRAALYMDDGVTRAYRDGAFARQVVAQRGGKLAFGEIAGGRPDFLKSVKHTVRVIGK